jgi:hypothetical protein
MNSSGAVGTSKEILSADSLALAIATHMLTLCKKK